VRIVDQVIPKYPEREVSDEMAEKFFYFIDNEKKRTISLTHFFSTVAILGSSPLTEKITTIYNFFDTNGKGYLEPKEFKKFITTVTDSIQILGRLIINPFFTKDLVALRQKISSHTKKLEVINRNHVDVEGYLKLGYSPYFDAIQDLSKLKIVITHPEAFEGQEAEDAEMLQPNYQRNLTTNFETQRMDSRRFSDDENSDPSYRESERQEEEQIIIEQPKQESFVDQQYQEESPRENQQLLQEERLEEEEERLETPVVEQTVTEVTEHHNTHVEVRREVLVEPVHEEIHRHIESQQLDHETREVKETSIEVVTETSVTTTHDPAHRESEFGNIQSPIITTINVKDPAVGKKQEVVDKEKGDTCKMCTIF